jgi:hypothetical protein
MMIVIFSLETFLSSFQRHLMLRLPILGSTVVGDHVPSQLPVIFAKDKSLVDLIPPNKDDDDDVQSLFVCAFLLLYVCAVVCMCVCE